MPIRIPVLIIPTLFVIIIIVAMKYYATGEAIL